MFRRPPRRCLHCTPVRRVCVCCYAVFLLPPHVLSLTAPDNPPPKVHVDAGAGTTPTLLSDDALMPPIQTVDVNATLRVPVPEQGIVRELRVFVPAGSSPDALAVRLCAEAVGANTTSCRTSVQQQLSRRLHQRMLYRRWVKSPYSGRSFLMTFEVYDGTPTREAAVAACDATSERHPDMDRGECLRLAVEEIEVMRIGRAWRTKTPSGSDAARAVAERADIAPFWRAVNELEDAMEERGHCLYDGHIAHCSQKIKFFFDVMKSSPQIKQVCEIGFNAGHSALTWLVGMPDAKVLSFDLGVHEYTTVARDVLQAKYPGRLELVLGDSADTVPRYLAQHPELRCNVIFIDGSHKYGPVVQDLLNIAPAADHEYGHVLIMDDFGCVENYCRNVRSAFYKLVHEYRVQERAIITTEEYTHIVGGGKTPVTNGMAAGIFFAEGYRQQLLQQQQLPLFDP